MVPSAPDTVRPMADVSVTLSPDEALVLFELLHRWEDAGWYESGDLLPGERTALWALFSGLERTLVEPFNDTYLDLVDQARERLRERGGE
jgi:hypothetical protein